MIRSTGVSKKYILGGPRASYGRLSESIVSGVRASVGALTGKRQRRGKTELWALKDVSFEVEQGVVLGVIGRNGAGKSTLLKCLSRVTEPTQGEIELRGRLASLLEVGTGFHPELTGRENIFLSAAILGMRKSETLRKFDEIVDFAEVERFLDTPVKRYSSGMYVRLAFAVAAHMEPEILIVDEVLAVGDLAFQKKSLAKMDDVSRGGRTVVIVSHNMGTVMKLCSQALLLEGGRVAAHGQTSAVVDRYVGSVSEQGGERLWSPDEESARRSEAFRPVALRVLNVRGSVTDHLLANEPFTVEFEYVLTRTLTDFRVGVYLFTGRGHMLFLAFDVDDASLYETFKTRGPGGFVSRCQIPADLLDGGNFIIGAEASSYNIARYFRDEHVLHVSVDSSAAVGSHWPEGPRGGMLRPALHWEVKTTA